MRRKLAIGFAAAVLVYVIPLTRFVFSALITLFHELGHAVMGWLLGHPSLPAFDFVYGGGFTHMGQFRLPLALAVAAGLAWAIWRFREHRQLTILLSVAAVIWLVFVTKEWRREIAIASAGHLAEFILAGIFFYKFLSGTYGASGAFVTFFVQIHSMHFAWKVANDADFLAAYREGKGGALMNDLEVVALDLNIYLGFNPGIEGVARMLLLFSLLPLVLALVLWKPVSGGPMRTRLALFCVVFLSAFAVFADEPMCGTSEELEQRIRARHEQRERQRSPIAVNAVTLPATVRDGAFYMQADDAIASGGHLFDLEGKSLIFEPRGSKFAARRVDLQYQPAGELLHDFGPRTGSPWHYVTYDLQSFAFPIFGRNVTKLYLTAFNEIEFDVPSEEGTAVFDELEAAVHRNAVLSPLAITTRKPRQLAYPQLFVREEGNSLFVTWSSTAGETFGYDVQAELRGDGTVVYSYKSMREMEWGTPLLSAGFNPASGGTARRSFGVSSSLTGVNSSFGALAPMLDIRSTEVFRLGESDLLGVRLTLAAPIDLTKLSDADTLRYLLTVSNEPTYIDVKKSGVTVYPFGGLATVANGATVQIDGDKVEFYLLQSPVNVTTPMMRAFTQVRPSRTADAHSWLPTLDVAPRATGNDLSAVTAGQELALPIAEPFVLPELDPIEVWDRIQPAFAVSKHDVDAVAIYQTFYTDMIFYAGAYSMSGNPAVNGIAPTSASYGVGVRRAPNLLHMNHFKYNYNAATETASQVILHEFGHRWLYFFRFLDGGAISSALNPVSAHPAAYVNTPAAFPVFREGESSVMGGAVFTQEGANAYRTRVSNRGFSWMDLYLMGLASPQEVAPWFYLTGTTLRAEYWPDDNVVVTGEKKEVKLDQVVAVHGERNPSTALAQKKFRVLFVLVTEPGKDATAEDVAKINEWRALLEQTFYLATGARGRVETEYVQVAKKRATR